MIPTHAHTYTYHKKKEGKKERRFKSRQTTGTPLFFFCPMPCFGTVAMLGAAISMDALQSRSARITMARTKNPADLDASVFCNHAFRRFICTAVSSSCFLRCELALFFSYFHAYSCFGFFVSPVLFCFCCYCCCFLHATKPIFQSVVVAGEDLSWSFVRRQITPKKQLCASPIKKVMYSLRRNAHDEAPALLWVYWHPKLQKRQLIIVFCFLDLM